jgi:DNA polymerase V
MFGLVDCIAFYCSAERVFRPDLAGVPLVVLSNNDGCAVARSDEAKALGIKMGDPAFTLREHCRKRGLRMLSSNYTLYGDMSGRVMTTLAEFAPVDVYSIDEAFVDLSVVPPKQHAALAAAAREAILRWTGIPTCVGIGRTKTMAKLANRRAKKLLTAGQGSGVCDLGSAPPAELEATLAATEVGDVWGVGPAYAAKLRAAGVLTALDLSRVDRRWAQATMTVVGLRTVLELAGEPCIPWDERPSPRRTVCVSRTLGAASDSPDVIGEAVATFAARGAEKLRRHGLAAGALHVWLDTDRFRSGDPQAHRALTVPLATPSDDSAELIAVAAGVLRRIWLDGYRWRKVGVLLLKLAKAETRQAGLFDRIDRPKSAALMGVLDDVHRRHGRDCLRFAAEGLRKDWQTRRENLSPRYTTRWDELPVARA